MNAVPSCVFKRALTCTDAVFHDCSGCHGCHSLIVVVIVNVSIIFECMSVYTCDYYIIRLFVEVVVAVVATAMVLIQCMQNRCLGFSFTSESHDI
jgi:hypothetical protein